MCWQGFAHFTCGHTLLFDGLCDYATLLDLPLFLKVECPNYTITHQETDLLCGKGRYYCAQSPDGAHLDRVHTVKQLAASHLDEIHRIFHEQISPKRQRVAQRLRAEAGEGNRLELDKLVEQDPEAQHCRALLHQLHVKKQFITAHMNRANAIIYQSRQLYSLHPHGADPTQSTVLPPLPAYLPPSAISRYPHPGDVQTNDPGAHMSWNGLSTNTKAEHMLVEPISDQPRTQASLAGSPSRLTSSVGAQQKQPVQGDQLPDTLSPVKKRQRAVSKTDEEDEPEVTVVRRSARARKIRINYAEVDSDASPTRTPSPVKSDVSTFSPTKSQDSEASTNTTPIRGQPATRASSRRKGGGSLGDMIRARAKHGISTDRPAREEASPDRRRRGRLSNFLPVNESSPMQAPQEKRPSGTPGTLRGSEGRTRAKARFMSPSEFSSRMSTLTSDWTIDRGDMDIIRVASGPLSNGTHETYGVGGTPRSLSHGVPVTPSFVRDRLAHPHILDPDTTSPNVNVARSDPTSIARDPNKRNITITTPIATTSNKKVRLTLPGQDASVPILQSNSSTSSPSKGAPMRRDSRAGSVAPLTENPSILSLSSHDTAVMLPGFEQTDGTEFPDLANLLNSDLLATEFFSE